MELELNINGVIKSLEVAPNESLLTVLRREGYTSVKHGCESGECGACTILVDGLPRPSCVTLAAQVGGCSLSTVESLGNARKLHPLQEAFIDTGAIQCGFCTPGMLLSASALLKRNASPGEEEVREALAGNLCRCTGYARPVQAVLRAAAVMRGEQVMPLSRPTTNASAQTWEADRSSQEFAPGKGASQQATGTAATLVEARPTSVAGQPEHRINAVKLATGKATFVDDIELRDMLYARILTSPHAHAVIREIDATEARALPGVHAVLTYKDVPRVAYTSAGQAWPEPGPHDQYALDNRVRFVGDRVAVVAAETPELAEQALRLIQVDYEVLPALLDPRLATSPQAPRIHPEAETYHIHDAEHNIAAYVHAEVGEIERGFGQAELVVEGEYVAPPVQHAPIEKHTVITYWDEDERLVVRSNSATPSHVRRIIAPVIGLPPRRIRVITPNIGGDFGGKQDVSIEDLCALLTITTNRPVHLELTRAEEFSSRSRHAQVIRMKTGVKRDGTIVANSMAVLANTGAYGAHALTAPRDTGAQALSLYPCPHMRFEAQVVYTNQPPAGAFRGYGAPPGFFALESHLDEIARQLGMDALELRRKNWLKVGDRLALASKLNGSKEQSVKSCGLAECLRIVEEKVQWKEKHSKGGSGRFKRGVGVALAMHSPATLGQDLASASLKLNEDGSFHLLIGAVESESGASTLAAQVVAETLGVHIEEIVVQTSDTDAASFASGAGAYTSIGAARKAAELVRKQIMEVAGQMFNINPAQLTLRDRAISTPHGKSVTLSQVALHALYVEQQQQITATASWVSQQASPAFAAQGVEVEVDTETGVVHVIKIISAIEAGRVLNPVFAEGQIEGEVAQALGWGISEELVYDQRGSLLTANLSDYGILNALDIPGIETALVETEDPAGPCGAKDATEIAVDALAPALANAVTDALGVRLRQVPLTPERVLRALRAQNRNG